MEPVLMGISKIGMSPKDIEELIGGQRDRHRAPELGTCHSIQCDVYSFGVFLYELMAGKRVFAGEEDDGACALLRAGGRPSVNELAPYDDLIKRCWAEDPIERLTMSEVVALLGRKCKKECEREFMAYKDRFAEWE
jgi:hypothetical protein